MTNFKEMSLTELRRYVLDNRDDQKAWDEFASRERPNAVTIEPNVSTEQMGQIIEETIKKQSS